MVGAALNCPEAARRARAVLRTGDFYLPAHARLYDAALDITDEQEGMDSAQRVEAGWDQQRRIREGAERAEVELDRVAYLVHRTPVLWAVEPWVARIAAASKRRQAMGLLASAYDVIGDSWADRVANPVIAVHDDLADCVEALLSTVRELQGAA